MIEQIIDGIWEDLDRRIGHSYIHTLTKDKLKEIKCRWRIIIRKAISESSCSQAMLEETAVMDR